MVDVEFAEATAGRPSGTTPGSLVDEVEDPWHHHHIDNCPLSTSSVIVAKAQAGVIISASQAAVTLILGPPPVPEFAPEEEEDSEGEDNLPLSMREPEQRAFEATIPPADNASLEETRTLVGRYISEFITQPPLQQQIASKYSFTEPVQARLPSLELVELPPIASTSEARYAYSCVHTLRMEDHTPLQVWFLEDVTALQTLSNNLSKPDTDSDTSESSISWIASILRHPGSEVQPITPSLSHQATLSSTPIQSSIVAAADVVLAVTEEKVTAIAGIVGLGTIPKWIFTQIRSFTKANPPLENVYQSSNSTTNTLYAPQPTLTIRLNSFGRIQQVFPMVNFLGQTSELLMNRFIMRFVYEDDIHILCKSFSHAIKSGFSEVYVRWDWKSKSGEETSRMARSRPRYPTKPHVPLIETHARGPQDSGCLLPNRNEPQTSPPPKEPRALPVPRTPRSHHRRHSESEPSSSSIAPIQYPPSPSQNKVHISNTTKPQPEQHHDEAISIRLAWVKIQAILDISQRPPLESDDTDSGPPMDLICIVTVLPSPIGEAPTTNWVSDSTIGPVNPNHAVGPMLPHSTSLRRTAFSTPTLPSLSQSNLPRYTPATTTTDLSEPPKLLMRSWTMVPIGFLFNNVLLFLRSRWFSWARVLSLPFANVIDDGENRGRTGNRRGRIERSLSSSPMARQISYR